MALFVALIGCGNEFQVERAYEQANQAYQGSDVRQAQAALIAFIEGAEQNEAQSRKAKNLDYDRALSMAWLQLASTYEATGESIKGDKALRQAVNYFDRVEQIARNSDYKSDPKIWLRNLLEQTESRFTPAWKKRAKPDE